MLLLLVLLYLFILGVKLFGTGFKQMGAGLAATLLGKASNPVMGLFIGILATALMQSSSATTSMLVGLVAAGAIDVRAAVPIVMGANIGTTATNTLVSLAHITRRGEFRRAMGASSVHDFFNILTVCVLLPVELRTHPLERIAGAMSQYAGRLGGGAIQSPLKLALRPAVRLVETVLAPVSQWSPKVAAVLLVSVAAGLLFCSLIGLTKVMKRLMATRVESALTKALKSNAYTAMAVGCGVTVLVQSSSITTSLMVPLAASGILTLAQVYPVTLGANVGTTVTALIAAMAGTPEALALALVHLLFNVAGILIFYVPPPLRELPLALARMLGRFAWRYRGLTIVYIVVVFYIIPAMIIALGWGR